MKKITKFSFMTLLMLLLFITGSSQDRKSDRAARIQQRAQAALSLQGEGEYDYCSFSFDKIQFWVGEGENQAALVIDWHDGKGSNSALVWGYRWPEGEVRHGIDMILAVAKADERLMFMGGYSWDWTIGGFGYDVTNSGEPQYITRNGENRYPDENGVINMGSNYDYDNWEHGDPASHFQSGWMNGYWSYQVSDGDGNGIEFSYSGMGAGSRELQNNSVDGWGYQDGWDSWEGVLPRMPFVYVSTPTPPVVHVTDVQLNIHEKELFKDGTVQLSATVLPEDAENKNVLWESGDSDIATVSATGLVTAVDLGEVYIYAISEDENKKDSCLVNVVVNPYDYSSFSFDEIEFWVGEGENQAALVIDWHDGKGSNSALVWGYRWPEGEVRHGIDMILAVAKADERLMFMGGYSWSWTIGGFGYDVTNNGEPQYITRNGVTHYPNEDGVIDLGGNYDYDNWEHGDPASHFRSGWMNGYWSYQVSDGDGIEFSYSGLGAGSHELQNNSVDGWGYQDGWDSWEGVLPRMPFVYVPAPTPPVVHVTELVLDTHEKTLFKKGGLQLSVTVLPEDADNKNVTWESGDSDIATVSAAGLVTAIDLGETYIYAVSEDGAVKDSCLVSVVTASYDKGVFFVNEDWFGHNNSTVNFLHEDGNWYYKVYQEANPGKQLGATSQFGAIYGDKFFIVSKQDQDPSASVLGSRFAVADAKTMESLAEFTSIGGADGRSFLGVNEHKGYIGTSNGIYVFDIDNLSIGAQIEGTGDSNGSLYSAQIGSMVRAADKVFAVHQRDGLLVINPETDQLESVIKAPLDGTNQRGFGSVVQSKDGMLWLSITSNVSGNGNAEDYILKLNPQTMDTVRVDLPTGTSVPNSWYAWTADGFCASTQNNKLYWKNNGGWFHSTKIYEYDIETNTLRTALDLRDGSFEPENNWAIYGAGFRLDPLTDEIYVSLFRDFGVATYTVAKVNPATGSVIASYPMASNYWFPAMPVFPDNELPVVAGLEDISIENDTVIYLGDKVSDADNMQVAIVKSLLNVENELLIDAYIANDSLYISSMNPEFTSQSTSLTIRFNSNGKLVDQTILVEVAGKPVVEVESVSLDKQNLSLEEGDSYQLIATVLPEDATNKNVFWTSSDEQIVSVDENGLVTAVGSGIATVTVTTEDGALTDVCEVKAGTATGTGNVTGENSFRVYPNPFIDYILIDTDVDCQLAIYDQTGRVVLRQNLTAGQNRIQVSTLPKGSYIVKSENNTVRIIK